MDLNGHNILGSSFSSEGTDTFQAVNPSTGEILTPQYHQATAEEIDRALTLAVEAFHDNRDRSFQARAKLLEQMADAVESLGEELVERVVLETALGEGRVKSEQGRTVKQIRMFADLIREGSWVNARIDQGRPDRTPSPKPDIRRMLIPIGPVAVFGASNFPLAFSVAGGDTASALAAGCPVIVKAHPAHPGTSELVARAIMETVDASPFHEGTFSMVYGERPDISIQLVEHPSTCAVGFTGSRKAGRAIFDAASSRPEPIPVYAEMGSVNPVFLLPGALRERSDTISEGLTQSVNLGVGQFCTNPGLVFGIESEPLERFIQVTGEQVNQVPTGIMLHQGIRNAYKQGIDTFQQVGNVEIAAQSRSGADNTGTEAPSTLMVTDADTFLANPRLAEEVFGPSTLIIRCRSAGNMESVAGALEGNLTASIHGTDEDLAAHRALVRILEEKVGRLIFNGFPTGVEVCASMHHGGPYPATTDVKFTSVGTAAIYRFTRPICYQNFPQEGLPPELQDRNPKQIWRLVDNQYSKESL